MKRALSILVAALLLLLAVPTFAEEGELQAGLYVSDAGTASMYLYEEGVGVLNCLMDDGMLYSNGVVWTGNSLEIERNETSYVLTEDVLSFTYDGVALALRYQGEWDAFVLGEQEGSAFAGEYEAEDGKKLTLTADGQGVYTDDAGEEPIYWGSFLSYFQGVSGMTVNNCYILYGSYLGAMDFVDGEVQLDTETEGKITLLPVAAIGAPEAEAEQPEAEAEAEVPEAEVEAPEAEAEAPEAEAETPEAEAETPEAEAEEPEAETEAEAPEAEAEAPEAEAEAPEAEPPVEVTPSTTVISRALDLCITLPEDAWTVEETESGLLITRNKDYVQYTILSLEMENAPDAALLDAYADHIWTDGLMGAGVAYDAAETLRGDLAVGEAAGRTAATDWIQDEVPVTGDMVLWHANGRLFVALCVANEETRAEGVQVLENALQTVRPADALGVVNLLPLDKEVFDGVKDLVVTEVTEDQVYYGYRMISDGQSFDLVPFLTAMGMDPKDISLVLRADGTGRIQFMDESESGEFTWTEDALTADEETIPYTREGTHILITAGEDVIEFAPAAEVEALVAEAGSSEKSAETVIPTVEDLAGSWTFTKAKALGLEIPASEIGTSLTLVLNEDGTVTRLADGTPDELTWVIQEDGRVSLTVADEEIYAMTYDGTVLILDTGVNGMEMIFEKEN